MPESTPVTLTVDADELQLVIAALRLLEDTLGHDEADELHAVKALLAKVEAAAKGQAGR